MISYIVIGRNEEKNLRKCIIGIYESVLFLGSQQYEIIYVDSKSTDKSLEIAKEFNEIKLIEITGVCNAAIARNIGAKESKGEILFFIDADMEINAEFIADILDQSGKLKFNIVSGQLIDIINGVETTRFSNKFLGGIFLIRREIWESVNGMRTKYKTGEDLDLGLRLYEKGIHLHRKNSIITKHYTTDTFDKRRMWKMIWNMSAFYARSMLYREHIFSKQLYLKIWAVDKTFILLVLFLILSCLISFISPFLMLIYLLSVFLRSLKQKNDINILELLMYYVVINLLTIIFIFTFFPKSKQLEYLIVKR